MKTHRTIVILALLAAFTAPAFADESGDARLDQAVAAHNEKADSEGEKVVCRKEARIGSRIKETVCRTQRTIDAEQEAGKKYVNKPRPVPYQD